MTPTLVGDPTVDVPERIDLTRRVQLALRLAGSALDLAVVDDAAVGPDTKDDDDVQPLHLAKVVAEAALLARCAADADDQFAADIDSLARRLVPFARSDSVLAALCREPASALVHATAHIQLRDLGYDGPAVDALLSEIDGGEDVGGPELAPGQAIETDWLRRVWLNDWDVRSADIDALRRTCLGRRVDAIASATQDLYAFTHVILYASDMGRRHVVLPRPTADVVADAEAGLAAAIDAGNLDLAAELLWTWPMLDIRWSPAAAFAFGILATAQDELGFVPGPGLDPDVLNGLEGEDRDRYALRTSYHATFVMGFLCAAALRNVMAPVPVPEDPDAERADAVDAILPLLEHGLRVPRWLAGFDALDRDAQTQLAPFLLSIALRRASTSGDLALVRRTLEVAVRFRLTDGPAVRQSVALLRRATLLGRILAPE